MILARFWEALEAPKIKKNRKKLVLGWIWKAFGVPWWLLQGFERVLGRFGQGLGGVLEGFWEGLGEYFRCVVSFRLNFGSKCFAEACVFGETCVKHPRLQNLL